MLDARSTVRRAAGRRRCASTHTNGESDAQTTSARREAGSFLLIKRNIPGSARTEKLAVRKKGDRRPPVRLAQTRRQKARGKRQRAKVKKQFLARSASSPLPFAF